MNVLEKAEYERQLLLRNSDSFRFLNNRLGLISNEHFTPGTVQGVDDLSHLLLNQGGFAQQERMIRDKRRTLDKAVLYSYQGALVTKHFTEDEETLESTAPVRALINPNKVKQDYDDKILSIGYEYNYQPGDVFKWIGTNTYWLIYLQDLTELAYFRGQIRKCSYEIKWKDDDGLHSTFAALTGPSETRIDTIQKYGNSYDQPNYSLSILLPKTEDNLKHFTRYSKFYLSDGIHQVCWRVEAVDAFSMIGVMQLTAVEYYANKDKDNIPEGLVDSPVEEDTAPVGLLLTKAVMAPRETIDGEEFIKPKREYIYTWLNASQGQWIINKRYPIKYESYINNKGMPAIKLKWNNNYSGQFDLVFKTTEGEEDTKTIVVESLF